MRILGRYKNKQGQTITDRIIGIPESRFIYVLTSVIEYKKHDHGYYAIELRHLKKKINDKEIKKIQKDYSPNKIQKVVDSSLTEEDIEMLQFIPLVKVKEDNKEQKNVLIISRLLDGTIVARNKDIYDKDAEEFIISLDRNIITAKHRVQRLKEKNENETEK